ncbi:DUF2163 domain-containing protein [Tabrizicola piscis]|uniref:DUF2163 domain-containing protein n=1 Tax=Tabrizicola piscis TaxID=2494374 RepID=A0A3S8UAQ8_9RHOB|nr:DUF2163 domain-containing protein [Tabrizicola piscis]AZL60822.1 DUF2163 domain-containing protein [Tabrizicola piscis]
MSSDALYLHLQSGATTVCRAWTVRRTDGTLLGFTDHDRDLVVDGITCRADTGLTARALQQTTGLSVDNTEAVGALSDGSIREADLLAGRFDAADVRSYLVNWAMPGVWIEQFRGTFGEIVRAGGAFRAELRGLTEALNRPQGFAYQPGCSAVLGDSRCKFQTDTTGYFAENAVEVVDDCRVFDFASFGGFEDRWFEHGRFEVMTGEAAGLVGVVKNDRLTADGRQIELWQSIGAVVLPGDRFRVFAGCSKSAATCRNKFANTLNFRGFPHIPGEDWLASYPVSDRPNTGRARNSAAGS